LPRPADARDEPADAADDQAVAAVGFTGVAVEAIDGGGADSDQELVVPGSRPLHLLDAEDAGRSVAVVDDGFHIERKSGMLCAGRGDSAVCDLLAWYSALAAGAGTDPTHRANPARLPALCHSGMVLGGVSGGSPGRGPGAWEGLRWVTG